MICVYFGLDQTPTFIQQDIDGGVFVKSNYHYEFDYNTSSVDLIKSIVKNVTVNGKKRVFFLRGVARANKQLQHKLKHIIDSYDATFIILSKTVGNIDSAVLSRAIMMRLSFDRTRLARFLSTKYDVELPAPGKSVVCAIAKIGKPSYQKELVELLNKMKTNNEMKTATAIKQYCYKVFERCIPLAVIASMTIEELSEHPRIYEIVSSCADAEHSMSIGTKEILNYEQLFINVWQLIR